jgi:hypothetical protein
MHIMLANVFHSIKKVTRFYPKGPSLFPSFSSILCLWSTYSPFLQLLNYFISSVCKWSFFIYTMASILYNLPSNSLYTAQPTHYLTPTLIIGVMSSLYAPYKVIMYRPHQHHAFLYDKGKVNKVHPITSHESKEGEYRYNSTLSSTTALARWGWASGPVWIGVEQLTPLGFEP